MDVAALLTPLGQRALGAADELADADPLRAAAALRRSYPPHLAADALTQTRLRRRAHDKFGADAARMLFTAEGLEQATRPRVAALRARRFAGRAPVVDLGCGIGGDLLALARCCEAVTGVERDATTAAIARANADSLGLRARARVVRADATTYDVAGVAAGFVDPSRRRGERRVHGPDAYLPPLRWVLSELRARLPALAVKVAPGIPHALVPAGAEAEWVSDAGEVKEAVLWCGGLASGAARRATLLPSGATLVADPGLGPPSVAPVRRYLYAPDGAVVRAGLIAELATQLGGSLLDPTIAYVGSDRRIATPFARALEVRDVLGFSLKRLRSLLRARGVGRVEILKRGSAIDVERLRRDLRLSGEASATLVLTRVASTFTVLVCDSVSAQRGEGYAPG